MKKRIHWPSFIDRLLAFGGALIVVLQVTWMAADPYEKSVLTLRVQILVVGLGLIINQVGVWHLASQLLSARRYLTLRAEVDHFITLVRQLNTFTVRGDSAGVEGMTEAMHKSVDRMVSVAGVEDKPS